MFFSDTTLFTTSDITAREGEILENIPFINRHEVVKHIIEERIKARFPDIADPISEISDPSVFAEAGVCLNLALVLRENSSHKDDIFAVRAELYQRIFEKEILRAFDSLKFDTEENEGVELVR